MHLINSSLRGQILLTKALLACNPRPLLKPWMSPALMYNNYVARLIFLSPFEVLLLVLFTIIVFQSVVWL